MPGWAGRWYSVTSLCDDKRESCHTEDHPLFLPFPNGGRCLLCHSFSVSCGGFLGSLFCSTGLFSFPYTCPPVLSTAALWTESFMPRPWLFPRHSCLRKHVLSLHRRQAEGPLGCWERRRRTRAVECKAGRLHLEASFCRTVCIQIGSSSMWTMRCKGLGSTSPSHPYFLDIPHQFRRHFCQFSRNSYWTFDWSCAEFINWGIGILMLRSSVCIFQKYNALQMWAFLLQLSKTWSQASQSIQMSM